MGISITMVESSWKSLAITLFFTALHPLIMGYKRHLCTHDIVIFKTMSSVDVHAHEASEEPHGKQNWWQTCVALAAAPRPVLQALPPSTCGYCSMMRNPPNFSMMPPNASHPATSRRISSAASALVAWSRYKSLMGAFVAS